MNGKIIGWWSVLLFCMGVVGSLEAYKFYVENSLEKPLKLKVTWGDAGKYTKTLEIPAASKSNNPVFETKADPLRVKPADYQFYFYQPESINLAIKSTFRVAVGELWWFIDGAFIDKHLGSSLDNFIMVALPIATGLGTQTLYLGPWRIKVRVRWGNVYVTIDRNPM